MPLNLFYTMVQKSQKWPKTQIKGGPALNLLVLFRELSGRCGASTRRSCGNVTFGVDVGVLAWYRYIKHRHRHRTWRSHNSKPAGYAPPKTETTPLN